MTEIIAVKEGGIRIDKYLTNHFPYSRNFFHHIIERGGIEIRGKKVKKSYKLREGDKIHIDELERYLDGSVMEEAPQIDIPIVHEEDDFLVINKPKGVLSHPNSIRDVGSPSVVGRLYHTYKDLPSVGNFIRAGLIHRLDKDTDGLMIIAKTEAGLKHFKSLFQQKSESETIKEKEAVPLKKFYQARSYITPEGRDFLKKICHSGQAEGADPESIGELKSPHYIIADVIAKVPHSVPKEGITKILDFKITSSGGKSGSSSHCEEGGTNDVAIYPETVTLNIEILTGRTHQIRYHLSSLGLPIVGDYLYGQEEDTPMQLTAKKLIYTDLEQNQRESISPSTMIEH